MDERDNEPTDRAACDVCQGTGSLRVILGDEECEERCWSCNGNGVQMTRDELADDLRLVPEVDDDAEPERWDATGYRNHDQEIQAMLRDERRIA